MFLRETFPMISTPVPPEILERLLERLQSGWQPRRDGIDMRLPQFQFAAGHFCQIRPAELCNCPAA